MQWDYKQRNENVHLSFGDEIFATNAETVQSIVDTMFMENISNFVSDNICELGKGTGIIFLFLMRNITYMVGN